MLIERVNNIFPNTISETFKAAAVAPITSEDIKAALFSIPDNKSPGPDGYNALFFKKSWEIIKDDFIAAIRYFFSKNSLPRCVNATRVALVPKQEHPTCLNDFRPISCCNVIYKCIAKLIVVRLKTALADVVGHSQTAFLPGRNISDAILLTQELMHNYHQNKGPPRCALKIDLKKAFDTVRWDYIIAGLHAISLPQELISWITTCITTVHYTININGELHGFFKATRGIRQGDPLSPYLFVLAMEGLGGIIRRSIQDSTFHYHWRCKPNKLTHLCFADDLMLFCRADIDSVQVLKTSLDSFSMISGLNINLAKSSLYLSGIDANRKSTITGMLGIQEATLPVRYLGVPLLSSRLTHTDCIPLMERIIARIKLWTSTSLTYAGRLQLIKSVLFSIQVYWSSIFILPCATIKKIESTLAAFLWRGTSLSHAGAKVAWHAVCYPLNEGGLGVKNLKHWNQAATIKHIWHLLADRTSIWATWIHTILLRGRSFWQVNMPSNPTWSWRKILQSREWCRGWFIPIIGNGSSTSLWYDYWLPEGRRLIDASSLRSLTATGMPWNARVSAIIKDGQWNFPMATFTLQTSWHSIMFNPQPWLEDTYMWKGHSSGIFSIASAWELLRDKRPINTMHQLLWFTGHIPRQSFILWLAGIGRLRTMDRLQTAGIIMNATCILCGLHIETHEHLFFACPTTKTVWETVNGRANIYWPCSSWPNLLQWASTNYTRKNDIQHIIARLMLSATVYLLWQERNKRVFNHQFQSTPAMAEAVFQLVRTTISTMEFRGRIPITICNIWGIMDLHQLAED
jgi:mannosylglycoprotein endo-beta-mannosidase